MRVLGVNKGVTGWIVLTFESVQKSLDLGEI